MKYIIFDFNGTIVDDVDLSLDCFNDTRKHYLNLPPIDKAFYKKIFTFPVKDYYEAGGFDFTKYDFMEVGQYWMDEYIRRRKEAPLYDGVEEILKNNHLKGYKNIILSASKIENLKEHIKELGIYDYFDAILGIDNIYATSKLPIALEFIKDKPLKDCVMIGDTVHDAMVAKEMGISCILVSNGHQCKEILETVCDEVYEDLREVRL